MFNYIWENPIQENSKQPTVNELLKDLSVDQYIVNTMNQNKTHVILNKSISLLTLQYIAFTLANLSYSRKVQSQKCCGSYLSKE